MITNRIQQMSNSLAALLTDKKRRNIVIAAVFICIFAPLAIVNGLKEREYTDYKVFWFAGRHFFQGIPLYEYIIGTPYVYPPFFAMVFQLFAFLPLQIGFGIFYFLNALLWAFSIQLTYHIVKILMPDHKIGLTLGIAGVLSAQYFFMNMNAGQTNQIVFTFCLFGIYLALYERWILSSAIFVVAAFMKVTPVFFIIWQVIRHPRKTLAPTLTVMVTCFILPIALRGANQGIQDYKDYYTVVWKPFLHGNVVPSAPNQNLAGMIFRMTRYYQNNQNYDYHYVPLSEEASHTIIKTVSGILFTAFILYLGYQAYKKYPITALEVSAVFIASHLLSTITWRAHLVSLLFIFAAVFLVDRRRLSYYQRIFLYIIYAMIGIISVTGRDLVGTYIYFHLSGYSFVSWTLILLFIGTLWYSTSETKHKTV